MSELDDTLRNIEDATRHVQQMRIEGIGEGIAAEFSLDPIASAIADVLQRARRLSRQTLRGVSAVAVCTSHAELAVRLYADATHDSVDPTATRLNDGAHHLYDQFGKAEQDVVAMGDAAAIIADRLEAIVPYLTDYARSYEAFNDHLTTAEGQRVHTVADATAFSMHVQAAEGAD